VADARVNEAAFVLLEQTFVEQNLELHAELTVPFRCAQLISPEDFILISGVGCGYFAFGES
jgi:hypothetical protein